MLESEDWSAVSCVDIPVTEVLMAFSVDVIEVRVVPTFVNPFVTEAERVEKSAVTVVVRLVRLVCRVPRLDVTLLSVEVTPPKSEVTVLVRLDTLLARDVTPVCNVFSELPMFVREVCTVVR